MSSQNEEDWRKAAEAHKRAMPLQRLLGNGMDYADVVSLYSKVDGGQPWPQAAKELGDQNTDHAQRALNDGHLLTARSWYFLAAACYRVGQVPLPDTDPLKKSLYQQLIDAYARAGALSSPATDHVEIQGPGGPMFGWLMRPSEVQTQGQAPAVVVVFGGFDGWREEYHSGAMYLVERGLAVLLIDAPGQGETRLLGNVHMGTDVLSAFSAVIDHLYKDERLEPKVGLWGNSMGGYLAASAAASDSRVAACCVNGGTTRPAEILDRYPRFIDKVMPLLGIDAPAPARDELEKFVLTPQALGQLHCPLLVLHGTPDQVFLVENARHLYEAAASEDKTFLEWSDGDHCIYNHSHEKHVLIADWFSDQLNSGEATTDHTSDSIEDSYA